MGTHYLSTSRIIRNPVRVQQWNATIRAGDDFKLALTVYSDDWGTPADVTISRSQIQLCPDYRWYYNRSRDYGFAWASGGSLIPTPTGLPSIKVPGFVAVVGQYSLAGRLNFYIPGAITAHLWCGRYVLSVQVDLIDGEYSQIEGILQVRDAWMRPGLGHSPPRWFTLDVSTLDGPDVLAPTPNVLGQYVDSDGFQIQDTGWDTTNWPGPGTPYVATPPVAPPPTQPTNGAPGTAIYGADTYGDGSTYG